MKKIVIAGCLSFLIALLPFAPSYAHVLSEEAGGSTAALLHIMPDDDPTAGQSTTMYFDLQGFEGQTIKQVNVDVTLNETVIDRLPLSLDGTTASAPYIFKEAGTYKLALHVQTQSKNHDIIFTQIVTSDETKVNIYQYPWAIILFILCTAGIGLLIVGVIVKRKEIAAYSVMKK